MLYFVCFALRLVQDTLVLSASNLKHDVRSLAGQVTGRLLAFVPHYPNIARLLSQAERWSLAQQDPVFICRSPCLISPGGPLKTNLRGHTQRINNVAVTKDDTIITTAGKIAGIKMCWCGNWGEFQSLTNR